MRPSIRTSPAFWNNIYAIFVLSALALASGCVNRAPSIRMLDARAEYNNAPEDEEVALYQRGRRSQDSILRSSPRVAKVYVFPHELPTRDYFWGGYVSLLVSEDQWITEQSDDDAPEIPGIREQGIKK